MTFVIPQTTFPNYAQCAKTWSSSLVNPLSAPRIKRPHPKPTFRWTYTACSNPTMLSITNTTQALPNLASPSGRMKMFLDSRPHPPRLPCTTNTPVIAAIMRTSSILPGQRGLTLLRFVRVLCDLHSCSLCSPDNRCVVHSEKSDYPG